MQLSWSHKLFFLANRYIGRSSWFDDAVRFFAQQMIFLLFLLAIKDIGNLVDWQWGPFWRQTVRFGWGVVAAFTLSWVFGWLYPHRRPVIEFPEVKEIIRPFSHWKSLPSDHAIFSALLAYFILFLPEIELGLVVFYLVIATLISVARVFAGVHYPRDIVAGWVVATVVALVLFR